jgi:hypothetical protein
VRNLLDAELAPAQRMRDLHDICGQLTDEPLDATAADLREAIGGAIDMEGYRRLRILISHLYHACGADLILATRLCAEVNTAFGRRGEPTESAPGRR